ncbi:ABC transporter ATP-binding protein [Marinobacterium iners]|uniref:Iron complex transport system ATP-binding protein n=1 Tax=Marinobacterium iners DSM 11526 TaxID=1122198 RepID=A0A1H3XWV6_9GAMM|nr:ABC transporter ATP-binding protein [Marinobacterium iners]SEA03945.1 iron complex transport system ATP-binding protein [Marinobacterium iners DSM 11526]
MQQDPLDTAILSAKSVRLAYDQRCVADQLSLAIPKGRISVILGANGCGKSTLLRALARLLKPTTGHILLDGRDLRSYASRELARTLGLLPQAPNAPAGIRVWELVARGRYPHQGLLRQWSETDEQAVRQALANTDLSELAERPVDELSGGQRQRVWLAMALAQQPDVMLLDEPTTWLDIAHQFEVLELCRRLNHDQSKTLVMVLHDLNQAARYADHLIVLKAGQVIAEGPPEHVIKPDLIARAFGLNAVIIEDPVTATPLVVPIAGPAPTTGDPL